MSDCQKLMPPVRALVERSRPCYLRRVVGQVPAELEEVAAFLGNQAVG
jgi:hypothetical protein